MITTKAPITQRPMSPIRSESLRTGALHVVHAVLSLDVGGLERIVVDLARVGRRRGHPVSVLCLERPGNLAAAAEADGAAVISLGKVPGRTPRLAGRIARVLDELRADVVHTHQIGALWYVGAARSGVQILHTQHGDNLAISANGLLREVRSRLFWRMAARHAGLFCCVSESVARSATRWATVPRTKVRVVSNGIDTLRYASLQSGHGAATRAELGIPPGSTVVGTVGRLNEVKRQDLLLRAIAAMPGPPRPHVLIVGDGPERAALESLAVDLKLAGRTHFAGYQSSPERFLAAMDLFVMSSRMEGLPLSLLEAWATRLPVVCTAVGGIPAVVQDGVNGLLVPNGDTQALAAAIARVLASPALAGELAASGERLVRERYSLDRMASEYETLYRRLLRRGVGAASE